MPSPEEKLERERILDVGKAHMLGLPFDNREQQDVAAALACCILRARRVSDELRDDKVQPESPDDHHYWYTREACYPVSRRHGVLWSWVAMKVSSLALTEDDVVDLLSSRFWAEVAHPDVLAREIMES